MHRLPIITAMAVNDLRNIGRDPLLKWLILLPLLLALMIRWLVPMIQDRFEFDFRPYYMLMVSLFTSFTCPVLLGFITGFLLLDESDEYTLQAISVTPISLGFYLAVKLGFPVFATTILTLFCIPITGLIPFRLGYVPPVLLGAMWAPMLALAMAALAGDKLQGFVLMRVSNVLIFIPMAAWFIDSPWQYLFGVFPSYWPLKAFWLASEGRNMVLVLLAGAAFHAVLIAWFLRRFRLVLGRR